MMKNRKMMAVLLSIALVVTMMPMTASAKVKKVDTPSEVTELVSSANLEHNFVKVTTNGSSMTINCETPIEKERFSVTIRRVKPSSTGSQWLGYMSQMNYGDYTSLSYTFSAYGHKKWNGGDGEYVLMITMPSDDPTKSSDVFYKNCNFKVKNGQFSILQYDDILAENDKVQSKVTLKPSKYKNTYLKDVRTYVFKNPKTKKVASVTKSKVSYFKKVSKAVTKGAETDYEKVLKIYEYIAKNFYYDDVAFDSGKNQYVDPYDNLYALRNNNKKKKPNAAKGGKVASTCVGYGAAVVALCRAEGIPARIVNGHHVALGGRGWYNWSNEPEITEIDHWWAEAYVDGRWITVDPTPGNGNRYNSKTKTWSYTGITNYIYFDPTPEQLATSHVRLNYIYKK